MENSIKAYQGKSFSVTLQSMIGSTGYGWCLMSLPSCFVLAGQSNQPVKSGVVAPTNQVFYFLTVGESGGKEVKLIFGLFKLNGGLARPFAPEKTVEVSVVVIPYNKKDDASSPFLKYSENAAFYTEQSENLLVNVLYGYPPVQNNDDCDCTGLKYGYPALKYGYPVVVKYGYPVFKYGYPCTDDCCDDDACANLKYGYPNGC